MHLKGLSLSYVVIMRSRKARRMFAASVFTRQQILAMSRYAFDGIFCVDVAEVGRKPTLGRGRPTASSSRR